MKRYILILIFISMAAIVSAQNQTINGNLHVSNISGGNLRIGKINDIGNKAVPIGSLAAQYNLDFSGYRDVAPDQIGARIAALRFNNHVANNALVQKTGLAFYTNPAGGHEGTVDLIERMRITPEGNIGIGTATPQYTLHIEGETYSRSWFRVANNSGLFFQSWGGGFNMTDATWIRTYGNKNFYHNTGIMRTDGILHVGPDGNRFTVNANGNVGIGTTTPDQKLTVKGKIHAEEIIVDLKVPLADYVFKPDYKLMPLTELEQFVKTNSHLPEIPAADEVVESGLGIGEMQNKLLQKIEELTLYVIDLKKESQMQESRIGQLEEENRKLKATQR